MSFHGCFYLKRIQSTYDFMSAYIICMGSCGGNQTPAESVNVMRLFSSYLWCLFPKLYYVVLNRYVFYLSMFTYTTMMKLSISKAFEAGCTWVMCVG